jgi:N-acetylneuraminic acid mutarotase
MFLYARQPQLARLPGVSLLTLLAALALLASVLPPLPTPRLFEPTAGSPASQPTEPLAPALRALFPALAGLLNSETPYVPASQQTGASGAGGFVPQLASELAGAATLDAHFPQTYGGPMRVSAGGIEVVLRPLGARAASARLEAGQLVYRNAYHATDVLYSGSPQRSEEFMLLHSPQAPTQFAYQIEPLAEGIAVALEGGHVVFERRAGGASQAAQLRIDAPWLAEATASARRGELARWELGAPDAAGRRRLTLHVDTKDLHFPVVVDPSWSLVGSMLYPRAGHTATKLQDGTVLVAGGYIGDSGRALVAPAELYDPLTQTWRRVGSLTNPRYSHTATLLDDGQVLIVGGRPGGMSSELYNPASEAWTSVGALSVARINHAATLLGDGRVLVTGGISSTGVLSSAEIYSPSARAWTALTQTMTTRRAYHTATLLDDGRVLIAGGRTVSYPNDEPPGSGVLASGEFFDPQLLAFTPGPSLLAERAWHYAIALDGGDVLVVGGNNYYFDEQGEGVGSWLGDAERYISATASFTQAGVHGLSELGFSLKLEGGDVVAAGNTGNVMRYEAASNLWLPTERLIASRQAPAAALLDDGDLLITGGANASGTLASSEIYGIGTAGWREAAPMLTPRTNHALVLLADGRVLAAGGQSYPKGSDLLSAEIYNPASRRWQPASPMATTHVDVLGMLLPNGKALIMGGSPTAELYNPESESWEPAGEPGAPPGFTATRLRDGDVLVVGGRISGLTGITTTLRYDWESNSWEAMEPLRFGRYSHTATLLPDGRVLVAGGYDGQQPLAERVLNSAEIYDPEQNSWTTVASMRSPHYGHGAAPLRDGSALVISGFESGGGLGRTAERYSVAENRWTSAMTTTFGRVGPGLFVLANGQLLTRGTYGASEDITEIYDPAANTWRGAGRVLSGRSGAASVLLPDGSVLVTGGNDSSGYSLASAEVYLPLPGRWRKAAPAGIGRANTTGALPAAALLDGSVLIAGGSDNSAELYGSASAGWAATAGPLATPRTDHTLTTLADGRVLVAGGKDGSGAALASTELFDPTTRTFASAGSMGRARRNHTATLLRDGRVLVVGGRPSLGGAEIFDPVTSSWRATKTSPTFGRTDHTATLLRDGRVLVVSGSSTNSAEIFDPLTEGWSSTAPLLQQHRRHTATLLPDGRVLVAGNGSAELYDPESNDWRLAAAPLFTRFDHTATLLPDGRVLLVGGRSGAVASFRGVELYDPASDSWQTAPSLHAARYGHGAALLPSGEVLVVGGSDETGTLTSSEIYSSGFAISPTLRPAIVGAPALVAQSQPITITGRGFTGSTLGEGANDAGMPGSLPVVRVQSLTGGTVRYLSWDGSAHPADATLVSAPIGDFPPGPALLSVVVNAVASEARPIRVNARPRLGLVAPQELAANDPPLLVPLEIGDAESATAVLTTSVSVDNPQILRAAIELSGSERLLRLIPQGDRWGTTAVTVTVGDGLDTTSARVAVDVRRPSPPWMALIYLAADDTEAGARIGQTGLSEPASELLLRLQTMPYNSAVRVLVYYDGNKWGDTGVYVREPGGLLQLNPPGADPLWQGFPNGAELDSGSPTTLQQFVTFARENYPGARHTFLSIVNHGGGWAPDLDDESQPGGKKRQPGGWRGLSLDYDNGITTTASLIPSSLSTKETAEALKGLGRFDVLFFDACLMGMLESAVEVQPSADYFIAGQNLLWAGLPYEQYLSPTLLTAATTPISLAETIVERYNLPDGADSWDEVDPDRTVVEPFTIAAIDMSKLDAVVTATNTLADELRGALVSDSTAEDTLRRAYAASQKFDYDNNFAIDKDSDGFVDLANFAWQLDQPGQTINPAVSAAAQVVSTTVQAAVVKRRTVSDTSRWNPTKWNMDGANGLSIYLPLGEFDCRPTGFGGSPAPERRGNCSGSLTFSDIPNFEIFLEDQVSYYAEAGQITFRERAPAWPLLLKEVRPRAPRAPEKGPLQPVYPVTPDDSTSRVRETLTAQGATLVVDDVVAGVAVDIVVPANAIPATETRSLVFHGRPTPNELPTSTPTLYGILLALQTDDGQRAPELLVPATLTITYNEQLLDERGVDERDLAVLRYDTASVPPIWVALPPEQRQLDLVNNTISVSVTGTVELALVGAGDGADDLRADDGGIFVRGASSAGSPVELGLALKRDFGKRAIENVAVAFYLGDPQAGGRPLGTTSVPLLAPDGRAETQPLRWRLPAQGTYTLYALIDPQRRVFEADETNNVVSRTIAVATTRVDLIPPQVLRFSINGGAIDSEEQVVTLSVEATDREEQGGSGVRSVRFIEYAYNYATGGWLPAQDSGWLDYDRAPFTFSWVLQPEPGMKYIHAWARDFAGQISTYPYRALINYLPPAGQLGEGQAHVYRYALGAGKRLDLRLESLGGDADLALWSPATPQVASLQLSNARTPTDALRLIAPASGVYQVEVHGFRATSYRLDAVSAAVARQAQDSSAAGRALDPDKARPPQPTIPLDSVPAQLQPPPLSGDLRLTYLPLAQR